jgi:NAD(P)-dependent dehydrogenase (short-subunit alcohol dehydrogenase family)
MCADTAPRGALVTGGARGIGRAIAEALAAAGHTVVVADVDAAAATEAAAAMDARAVELDVRDVDAVRQTVSRVDADVALGVVVANAGVAFGKPLVDVVFFVVQAALRAMLPRGKGSIVTVCSTSSFTASTGPMAAYDASKAAVKLLTQAAAREVAPAGVRVNGVAPGPIETSLTRGLATPEQLADLGRSRVPLGRLGRPAEIGDAVVYLASDAASYVTGHVLVVDGGWLA